MLAYFAVTMFASATLLFFVQPMIGKMILPRLGGTPAVWNTCMVFFQAVLLLGYGYTHFVSTRLPKRAQLILQALLVLMPFAVLPFSLGNWTPPEESNPVFSVLAILAVVVGVPFFVVSTSAPLLQKWFAFTGHPSSEDPYFLYGASNLGSMMALVLYPLAMEPNFSLEPQTWIWTWGYGLFALMVLGCIALVWSKTKPEAPASERLDPLPTQPAVPTTTAVVAANRMRRSKIAIADQDAPTIAIAKDDRITIGRRLRWIALAAVPSSLMLGCTTYMTTDIAAIPFFWVVPLALYLMTFILVFARWPVSWTAPRTSATAAQTQASILILAVAGFLILAGIFMHLFVEGYANPFDFGIPHGLYLAAFLLFGVYWVVSGTGSPHDFVLYFQPCFLLFLVLQIVAHISRVPTWLEFMLHIMSFLFIALMCHGELALSRPSAKHLTEFYLCMSIGGVVGGLFNALVAPMLFKFGIIEYPLVMVLSCFLRPELATDVTLFPGDSSKGRPTVLGYVLDILLPVVVAGSIAVFLFTGLLTWLQEKSLHRNFMIAAAIVSILAMAMRPVRFGLALALAWTIFSIHDQSTYNYVYRDRGFFGLVKVRQTTDPDTYWTYNTLIHGGIDHGRQHVDPERRHEPAAYFHPLTGIGQVFMKLSWPQTSIPRSFQEYNNGPELEGWAFLPSGRFGVALLGLAADPMSALLAVENRVGTRAAGTTPYLTNALPSWQQRAGLVGIATDPLSALVAGQNRIAPTFSLPHWRFSTGLAGVANNPLAGLVALYSEPPYAVVGLGTGTLAAFAKPYQPVDMYEIDPLVYQLSQRVETKDPPFKKDPPFTYLIDAEARGANLKVILGDGRKKMEKAPENWYHVICLDAFASDAIPVHLLTVEAIQTYLDKLAPGGVLVFNTTNRYVNIAGVLKDSADHLGLECVCLSDWHRDMIPEKYGTDFVVLRRNEESIRRLNKTFSGGPSLFKRLDLENWNKLLDSMAVQYKHDNKGARMAWEPWKVPENLGGQLWTDRYSNLLGVLRLGN